jgi:hypothetical protein
MGEGEGIGLGELMRGRRRVSRTRRALGVVENGPQYCSPSLQIRFEKASEVEVDRRKGDRRREGSKGLSGNFGQKQERRLYRSHADPGSVLRTALYAWDSSGCFPLFSSLKIAVPVVSRVAQQDASRGERKENR